MLGPLLEVLLHAGNGILEPQHGAGARVIYQMQQSSLMVPRLNLYKTACGEWVISQ